MVSLPWCSSNADSPWHIPFSLSGGSQWMRALYRIFVRKPILHPYIKEESSHSEELSSPVTLTSLLIKTFEKVIRNQLVNFFDEHDLLNDSQHGFRKNEIMLEPTFWPISTISLASWELGNCCRCSVSRLRKGVRQGRYRHHPEKAEIPRNPRTPWQVAPKLPQWPPPISASWRGRSPSPNLSYQVYPRGSVLGPLLFLILIGDIDQDVATSFLSSFADDTRIGHGITSEEDMRQLQADLNSVYSWAVNNNMEFNSEKFEFIRYSPSRREPAAPGMEYHSNIGTPIKRQQYLRDLGVTISQDATFSQYISEKICKMKIKDQLGASYIPNQR